MQYLLKENEIHVWHACADSLNWQNLLGALTPDEIKRADRYYFLRDRENFIFSRGVLRVLIGEYLSIHHGQVNLYFNRYGKPFVKKNDGNLNFNVSHSNRQLLFAFSRNLKVGIDIEFVRHDFSLMEVASRFFSKTEMLMLSSLPEELKMPGFFNCWTRKEAFIKAKGKGLSIPLDSFDVSVCPGDPPELLCIQDDPKETKKWKIFSLDVPKEYCAAIAVKGKPQGVKHFEWKDELLQNGSRKMAQINI